MRRFSLAAHFLSVEHFLAFSGIEDEEFRHMSKEELKRCIVEMEPYRHIEFLQLQSDTGSRIEGNIIMVPFLPEHLLTEGEDFIVKKIIKAGKIALEDGAEILGLAGFTSIVGNEGEEISNSLPLAVTSGNTYTAALAVEGIENAAEEIGKKIANCTVAILGATGDIGSACARALAKKAKNIRLNARGLPKLEKFSNNLQAESTASIRCFRRIRDCVDGADIILAATSALTTLLDPVWIKNNAIICDVALPHNVGKHVVEKRRDLFVFEGGMARFGHSPLSHDPRWLSISNGGTTLFGCLAETMALAFEGNFKTCSLGRGKIDYNRMMSIRKLARSHGMELANFSYLGKKINLEQKRYVASSFSG